MSTVRASGERAAEGRHDVPKVARILLAVAGHTARDLAQGTGMSESQVSERLNGKTRISTEELVKWAGFLEVQPGLFFLDPADLREYLLRFPAKGASLRSAVADAA